ncbi:MmgE/PrpD family protein [Streptomyces brevispora]|jgi:2-methylcitrate dehydratase PrpD|uniref:2-methylcitrate dehydratase PrpD n=1 Tax=Streptomyces brevispora TaxID=887462 RepID=A0A561UUB0_9ACTN|nr:MmgE/PrpD family protein [Streptomyces brevispora]TWG02951.1 2-methylcitrate dehydratase PrpD [Streptomyces brevispora]WSC15953.1 MmgE/PrpD family protein [Streptomyces brevispora]
MNETLTEVLGEFAATADMGAMPHEVVDEAKRLVLDTLGCALGGVTEPKGRIGIDYGVLLGGSAGEATVFGTPRRSSPVGAAFANAELVSALDFDAVLPPGHVSPYVLPGTLAFAESGAVTGRKLIEAVAVAHEMTYRFGKAMDYVRDMTDGETKLAPVVGYACSVFGAAAAVGMVRGNPAETIAHALGIAGALSPVNSHGAWIRHAPSSTVKYTPAGPLVQAAISAALMAELGHRGDRQILDDAEFGYRRFIATARWEPSHLTDGLGTEWRFPTEATYKPYPHCRVLHAPLDALIGLVREHGIAPAEIDAIRLWGEGWIKEPVWLNNRIEHVQDAQFSIAHGLAAGAHDLPPSRAWQAPEFVFGDSVLGLMNKVTFEVHPEYTAQLAQHPSARPTRIEVDARGTTYAAERSFPKGSPSPDPDTTMTTDELAAKFRANADGVLTDADTEALIEGVLGLDKAEDVRPLLRQAAGRPD